MARNKFLKRMAVTALAASMTFGTVPAMATSAFAASVTADTFDTKTGDVTFDGWYTIDGVRLSGKPSKSGLYINNGRKVIIK